MIRKTELTAAQDTGLCPMFPCCRQSGLADRLFSLLVGRRHHHLRLLWVWSGSDTNRSYFSSPLCSGSGQPLMRPVQDG